MKNRLIIAVLLVLSFTACNSSKETSQVTPITMTKAVLMDKIKGGWAGQTIGVVYGAPAEFKFQGTTMQAYQPIPWNEHYVKY